MICTATCQARPQGEGVCVYIIPAQCNPFLSFLQIPQDIEAAVLHPKRSSKFSGKWVQSPRRHRVDRDAGGRNHHLRRLPVCRRPPMLLSPTGRLLLASSVHAGGSSKQWPNHQLPEISEVDFLIGSLPGCDLRAPGTDTTAVCCVCSPAIPAGSLYANSPPTQTASSSMAAALPFPRPGGQRSPANRPSRSSCKFTSNRRAQVSTSALPRWNKAAANSRSASSNSCGTDRPLSSGQGNPRTRAARGFARQQVSRRIVNASAHREAAAGNPGGWQAKLEQRAKAAHWRRPA